MTRTLLVALNVTDGSLLTDLAVDIENDLTSAGHDVVSVRPWGSPLDQLTPNAPITLSPTPSLSPVEPAPPQET